MAVFFVNNCTYSDCKKKFSTLPELIHHIEEYHIDFSPSVIEEKERQRIEYIPLSYILRYSQLCQYGVEQKDTSLRKTSIPVKIETESHLTEHDTALIESEISDDSWNDECNNDFINYSRRGLLDSDFIRKEEYAGRIKKFVCPVPGCTKRYKNINGIKYHTKNSHEIKRSPVKPKKMHKCHCGKSYKTIQGLKAHSISHRELSFCKTNPGSNSQLLTAQRVMHASHTHVHQNDIVNNNFVSKPISDEEMLPYQYHSPYLEQTPKLSDLVEYDHSNSGHFGFFTPPYSYGNPVGTEGFSDNLILEDTMNQNHQFSLTYRKY